MAAHEGPRTTKLYDRTGDEITLDEVERIQIEEIPAVLDRVRASLYFKSVMVGSIANGQPSIR